MNKIKYNLSKVAAFSMIEVSIYIIVFGIIISLVMYGESLLRMAKVQSVVSDVVSYRQSISSFREKYNSFPGDLRTANRLLDEERGDGSGFISPLNDDIVNESVNAWKHMVASGMLALDIDMESNLATGGGDASGYAYAWICFF